MSIKYGIEPLSIGKKRIDVHIYDMRTRDFRMLIGNMSRDQLIETKYWLQSASGKIRSYVINERRKDTKYISNDDDLVRSKFNQYAQMTTAKLKIKNANIKAANIAKSNKDKVEYLKKKEVEKNTLFNMMADEIGDERFLELCSELKDVLDKE